MEGAIVGMDSGSEGAIPARPGLDDLSLFTPWRKASSKGNLIP